MPAVGNFRRGAGFIFLYFTPACRAISHLSGAGEEQFKNIFMEIYEDVFKSFLTES
jgi:hypothetical protein